MSDEKKANVREMVANYVSLGRKSMRYWRRAAVLFPILVAAGLTWVVKKPRIYKSEASATIQDIAVDPDANAQSSDEAIANLRARLDQVYGSRANLGRVVDELHLYPWLQGRTSHLKIIGAFQDAFTYSSAGRDAFHLEFVYQDPAIAQRAVQRLLALYSEERRAAGETQARAELSSVNTALAGLETVLSDQEDRLERFERANHDMVEQVRLRRLGQIQSRVMGGLPVSAAMMPAPVEASPGETARTRRIRIRLYALQSRYASLQHSVTAPAPSPAAPAEESEHIQTLRHTVADLRERLARLRTTYTDEYPDVQVTQRRLADAERELAGGLAADRAHTRPAASTTTPEQMRAQLSSLAQEIDAAREQLSASVREDRANAAAHASAAAAVAPSAGTPAHEAPQSAPTPTANANATSTNLAGANDGIAADRPLGSLTEVEQAWDRLNAELTTSRTRYQQLLSHKFELQAQIETVNTTGADVLRVIDPPTLPAEPEPPGRTRLAVLVLALALLLSGGTCVLSGYLDSHVYEPADLRRWGELPILPAIPDLDDSREPALRTSSVDVPRPMAS